MPLNTRIIYQNITTLKSPPNTSAGSSTYTIQIFSPTHHPLLIIESNPNGSPLTLGASTERGGTVNRLLLYHRHYRRRQDYMAPHRFGHQVRSRLRWPRVFGTNSRHTLKPSRLYGRCTSSRIRVSLPTDVLWLFSQQQRFFFTTPNKVYYSLWMHTFRRSASEFGVIRSININTHTATHKFSSSPSHPVYCIRNTERERGTHVEHLHFTVLLVLHREGASA